MLINLKALLIIVFFVFLSSMNIFAQSPVPAGAILETLRTGFLQPEGPVWVDSAEYYSVISKAIKSIGGRRSITLSFLISIHQIVQMD